MERHYNYFIVKPDGIKYLQEISQLVDNTFESTRYYAIDDFENIIKQLYYKHYEQKGESFSKSFDSFLYGLKNFFGNKAILILVADTRYSYPDLSQKVFEIKFKIREKFVNDNIAMVTNYGTADRNYIQIISEDGTIRPNRVFKDIGNYRISDMNIIHSPDPDIQTVLAELNILLNSGIISDCNMLKNDMLSQIMDYKSVEFTNDIKKSNYEGFISPDISGFIKSEISSSYNADGR